MRYFKIIGTVFGCAILAMGCERVNNVIEEQSAQMSVEETEQLNIAGEEHINLEVDGLLKIDANVNASKMDQEEAKQITASVSSQTENELLKQIIGLEEVSWEEDELGNIYFSNEDYLVNIGQGVFYTTEWYDRISNYGVWINESVIEKNFETEKNLSFKKLEEAKTEVKELLKDIGITEVKMIKTYSVEEKALRSRAEMQNNIDITKDDEYYFFEMSMTLNGVPVKEFDYIRNDYLEVPGGGIQVAYNKNGIQFLQLSCIYEKIEEKKMKIISVEELIDILIEKANLVPLDEPMEVNEISLVYYPVYTGKGEVSLIPAWEVQLNIQDNMITRQYYDAVNGKEIVR